MGWPIFSFFSLCCFNSRCAKRKEKRSKIWRLKEQTAREQEISNGYQSLILTSILTFPFPLFRWLGKKFTSYVIFVPRSFVTRSKAHWVSSIASLMSLRLRAPQSRRDSSQRQSLGTGTSSNSISDMFKSPCITKTDLALFLRYHYDSSVLDAKKKDY